MFHSHAPLSTSMRFHSHPSPSPSPDSISLADDKDDYASGYSPKPTSGKPRRSAFREYQSELEARNMKGACKDSNQTSRFSRKTKSQLPARSKTLPIKNYCATSEPELQPKRGGCPKRGLKTRSANRIFDRPKEPSHGLGIAMRNACDVADSHNCNITSLRSRAISSMRKRHSKSCLPNWDVDNTQIDGREPVRSSCKLIPEIDRASKSGLPKIMLRSFPGGVRSENTFHMEPTYDMDTQKGNCDPGLRRSPFPSEDKADQNLYSDEEMSEEVVCPGTPSSLSSSVEDVWDCKEGNTSADSQDSSIGGSLTGMVQKTNGKTNKSHLVKTFSAMSSNDDLSTSHGVSTERTIGELTVCRLNGQQVTMRKNKMYEAGQIFPLEHPFKDLNEMDAVPEDTSFQERQASDNKSIDLSKSMQLPDVNNCIEKASNSKYLEQDTEVGAKEVCSTKNKTQRSSDQPQDVLQCQYLDVETDLDSTLFRQTHASFNNVANSRNICDRDFQMSVEQSASNQLHWPDFSYNLAPAAQETCGCGPASVAQEARIQPTYSEGFGNNCEKEIQNNVADSSMCEFQKSDGNTCLTNTDDQNSYVFIKSEPTVSVNDSRGLLHLSSTLDVNEIHKGNVWAHELEAAADQKRFGNLHTEAFRNPTVPETFQEKQTQRHIAGSNNFSRTIMSENGREETMDLSYKRGGAIPKPEGHVHQFEEVSFSQCETPLGLDKITLVQQDFAEGNELRNLRPMRFLNSHNHVICNNQTEQPFSASGLCLSQSEATVSVPRMTDLGNLSDYSSSLPRRAVHNSTNDGRSVSLPNTESLSTDTNAQSLPVSSDIEVPEDNVNHRASLSTEKFSSILSYLGQIEADILQDSSHLLQSPLTQKGNRPCFSGSCSPRTVLDCDDTLSLSETSNTLASSVKPVPIESATNCTERDWRYLNCSPNVAASVFKGIRKKMNDLMTRIGTQEARIQKLESEKEQLRMDKEKELSLEHERNVAELDHQATHYKSMIQQHLLANERISKEKDYLEQKFCDVARNISLEESQKHKKDVERIEMQFHDKMQKSLELQSLQHREQLCELRSHLLQERDEMIDKERLASHDRINEIIKRCEKQALEQRLHATNELTKKLEIMEANFHEEKKYAQELISQLEKEYTQREQEIEKGHEATIKEILNKKEEEILALKEKIDAKISLKIREKEKDFENKCLKDQELKIGYVTQKMEKDKQDCISHLEREQEKRVKELLQEKLSLLKKLKEIESHLTNLCKNAIEAKVRAEKEASNLHFQMTPLQMEIKRLQSLIEQERRNFKLQEEHHEIQVRQTDQHLQLTRHELNKARVEIQDIRIRKVEELEQLDARLRQAMEKKDLMIAGLRDQLFKAHEQIRTTELLLQEHTAIFAEADNMY